MNINHQPLLKEVYEKGRKARQKSMADKKQLPPWLQKKGEDDDNPVSPKNVKKGAVKRRIKEMAKKDDEKKDKKKAQKGY